jgi:hypothetical protein
MPGRRGGGGPGARDRGSGTATIAAFLAGVAVVGALLGYAAEKMTHRAGSGGSPAAASTSRATAPVSQLTGLTADQVAAKLAAAGLPLRTMQSYTAVNDPNQLLGTPGGYTSKMSFIDNRAGISPATALTTSRDPVDQGGSIEVFTDPTAAGARLAQLRQHGAPAGQLGAEYDYQQGDVLLRVSEYLTQANLTAYQNVFAALGAPASPTAGG